MSGWSVIRRYLASPMFHAAEFPGATTLDEMLRCCHGPEYQDMTPPRSATTALPGSEDKIAVMLRRHSDGEALWHPEDVRLVGRTGSPGADDEAGWDRETLVKLRLVHVRKGKGYRRMKF